MTQRNNSANLTPIVSRERVGNEINSALRLYVGRGRRYSVKQLSNATGVKDRVIECAMTDASSVDYRPLPIEALVSIAGFLGPDFTSEWLALAGQGAFDLPDDDDTPPGALAADNSDDNATLVRAAIDGKFDDDEKTDLKIVGTRMVSRGMILRSIAA
jgi:hypothetical protein